MQQFEVIHFGIDFVQVMRPKIKFIVAAALALVLHLVAVIKLPWAVMRLEDTFTLLTAPVTLSLDFQVMLTTTCLTVMDANTICINFLYDTITTNRQLQERPLNRQLTGSTCSNAATPDHYYYSGTSRETTVNSLSDCCNLCLQDSNCNYYYYYTGYTWNNYCDLLTTYSGLTYSYGYTYTRGSKSSSSTTGSQQPSPSPSSPTSSSQQPSPSPSSSTGGSQQPSPSPLTSNTTPNTPTTGTFQNDMVCQTDGTGYLYYSGYEWHVITADCCEACKQQAKCAYYYFAGTDCYLLSKYTATLPWSSSYTRGSLVDPSAVVSTYDYDCVKGIIDDLLKRIVNFFQGGIWVYVITLIIEPWLVKGLSPFMAPLCEAYRLLIGFALGPVICCGIILIIVYICMVYRFHTIAKALSHLPVLLALLVVIMWQVHISKPLRSSGFNTNGKGLICLCVALPFYSLCAFYVSRHVKSLAQANIPVIPKPQLNNPSTEQNIQNFVNIAQIQEQVLTTDKKMEDGTLLSRLLRSASAVSLPVPSLALASSKSTPALAAMDAPLPALPCLKQGQLLIEVDGIQGQWEAYDVSLVGNDITNLSLVYGKNAENAKPRFIRLHSASVDLMEEIFSIITNEQTWYLCAQNQKEAEEWADAICGALEAAAVNSDINHSAQRRLTSHVTASTVKEIQTRDIFTRVDEFLEIYVRSDLHDIHRQATRGALSWSCLRNLMWRVWLGILPGTATFDQWVPITSSNREQYTSYQQQYRFILPSSLDEDDIHYCSCPSPKNTTALLHSIYRDVVRTRCSMPYFREPHVQTMMIRILYIYAQVHPHFGYHQGMGELLAVFVYLLYIEQYPRDEQGSPRDGRWSFEAVPADVSWNDQSYVHVDKIDAPKVVSYLDKGHFLSSIPFVIDESTPTTSCKEAIIDILSSVTNGEFIEHDAFYLFEKLMERMDGFFSTANESTVGLHVQLEHVQYGLLSQLDPEVGLHLNHLNLLPEVYLVKWVRLLFAREFPMYQVWVLWDAIFSVSGDNLSFVHYLCVAMLHEMRDEILLQDDASGIIECIKKSNISFTKIVDKAREMHERILIDEAMVLAQSNCNIGPTSK